MTLVAGIIDPFADAPAFRMVAARGKTIAEIVAAVPGLPDWFWRVGTVRIDGALVYRRHWKRVRPLERARTGEQILVTLHPPAPQGGRGKQALGLLAAILVAVATGGIAAFGIPGLVVVGTFGSNLVAAGVGIVGRMVIQALTPPPVAPNLGGQEQRTQAGIAGNAIAPLRTLPAVLGGLTYSPPHLIRPYTTIHGKDGDLRAHAIVGAAGRHLLEDIEINGIAVADIAGVQIQTREGAAGDAALTLNATTAVEQQAGIQLTNMQLAEPDNEAVEDQDEPANSEPQWHVVKTKGGWTRFSVRLLFPGGLFRTEEDGPERAVVPVRLGLRKRGSALWIDGPELHFSRRKLAASAWRTEISFERGDVPTGALTALPIDSSNQPAAYFRAGAGQDFVYEANAYFNPGSGDLANKIVRYTEGYRIHLDETFEEGEYEFRFKRGVAFYRANFSAAGYDYNGTTANAYFFTPQDNGGTFEAPVPQDKYSDLVSIETTLTETDDYPFGFTGGVTLLSIQADAVQVQSISARFTRYAGIWNGSNWATVQPTKNPAALYRHVLLDADNVDATSDSLIEPGNLEAFYTACAAAGYECNAVADGMSVDQVLQMIASAGWAMPRNNGLRGVIREYDRSGEAISQKFTPLNSAGFSVRKEFGDLPHGLRVEFYDEADGFQLRDTYVYADGYDRLTATRFEALTETGPTNRQKVRDKGLLYLRQLYKRRLRYTVDVPPQVLIAKRGDLVGLTNDVLALNHGFGLVKTLLTDAGTVTGVVLRQPVDMGFSGSATPGCAITLKNGAEIFKQLVPAAGKTATLTFVTPFAVTPDLGPGCIVSVGVLGQEYRRAVIQRIDFKKDFAASLQLLDEAPDIHPCVAPPEEDAPGLVTGSAWAFVAASEAVTSAAGNLVLAEPAGAAEGDLLVATIARRGSEAFTLPAGWTLCEAVNNAAGSSGAARSSATMAFIVRGPTAPALTFTRSGGDVALGAVVAFRGVKPVAPLDDVEKGTLGMTSSGGAASWETLAELSAGTGDELIVMMGAEAPDPTFGLSGPVGVSSADPSPGDFVSRVAASTTTGSDVGLAVVSAVKRRNGGTGGLSVNFFSDSAEHAVIAAAFKGANS